MSDIHGTGCNPCGECMGLMMTVKVLSEERVAEISRLRAALGEIAKGEGPFSRDPLTHASATIEAMKELALAALSAPGGVGE